MIEVTQDGAVATITMADASPLSVHDIGFGTALRDAVRDAADSDAVKAIVIRAGGPDFAPALGGPDDAAHAFDGAWRETYAAATGLYQTLCYSRKIVITAVRGACMGAGSLLVLCSDLTVASADARFGSPFDALPESNLVLAALVMRLNRAKAWVLCPDALAAADACDAGLVNRVVPAGDLDREARAMARAAAKMPLDGIAMSKIQLETCLDANGVGREFDMAGFYAESLRHARDDAGAGGPR